MPQWVTVGDVADVYEGTPPTRTEALLERLETRLKRILPDIQTRLAITSATDPNRLDATLLRDVLVDAALRQIRNPKGLTRERDGDYEYSVGRPGNAADRKAPRSSWFTDEELELLAPRGSSPVGSINLGISMPLDIDRPAHTRDVLQARDDERIARQIGYPL